MSTSGEGDGGGRTEPDWYAVPRDPNSAPPPVGYPQAGYQPPHDAPPPYGYVAPDPHGAPYGYATPYGYGVPGRIRPTSTSIVLFFCTLGIYMYVYNFKVHDEMKRFSGRGIGGGIALLLTFLGQIAMPFVTPAEVGSLYSYRGQQPPVNGWTGLWHLLSLIGAYVGFFIVLIIGTASSNANDNISTAGAVVVGVGIVCCVAIAVAGSTIWFVKTNRALNAYWESLGVTA